MKYYAGFQFSRARNMVNYKIALFALRFSIEVLRMPGSGLGQTLTLTG